MRCRHLEEDDSLSPNKVGDVALCSDCYRKLLRLAEKEYLPILAEYFLEDGEDLPS